MTRQHQAQGEIACQRKLFHGRARLPRNDLSLHECWRANAIANALLMMPSSSELPKAAQRAMDKNFKIYMPYHRISTANHR
ncbi:MAG: hypothetical protein PUP46_05415 [Endozoicomonas sp. (ex Botrylloides leachii)]|nr:hypothetical protein [Endozoicomonas sp. (ex Botrylloides leachii)]